MPLPDQTRSGCATIYRNQPNVLLGRGLGKPNPAEVWVWRALHSARLCTKWHNIIKRTSQLRYVHLNVNKICYCCSISFRILASCSVGTSSFLNILNGTHFARSIAVMVSLQNETYSRIMTQVWFNGVKYRPVCDLIAETRNSPPFDFPAVAMENDIAKHQQYYVSKWI